MQFPSSSSLSSACPRNLSKSSLEYDEDEATRALASVPRDFQLPALSLENGPVSACVATALEELPDHQAGDRVSGLLGRCPTDVGEDHYGEVLVRREPDVAEPLKIRPRVLQHFT